MIRSFEVLEDEHYYSFVQYEDDEEASVSRTIPKNEAVDARGKPISQQSVNDVLINIEVFLPHGEDILTVKLIRCSVVDEVANYPVRLILSAM